MNDDLYDAPLATPIDDLLGVAPSAKVLATRLRDVSPPFTAGIYGEWGSGKTSFVSFVAHYLSEEFLRQDGSSRVAFIYFSAWRYKNADEIWRALILAIGRKLLGIPEVPEPAPVEPDGWTLKRFLASDVVVFRGERPVPNARTRYDELVARLDSGLYGGISKSSGAAFRLNSTEAGLALTKGLVAALGGMSPLVAGLHKLLGFSTDVDATKLFDREQNESTRRRIESMDTFAATLKSLFSDSLGDRRVLVFVDDLDRCMPDAALDLLDAISIFLNQNVPCVFMVAADEVLIGQGLKMRLRDAVQPEKDANAQKYLETKGREYFEKIIQLPVRLPRPGSADIQNFIGAAFPEWMPASDLVEAAIGTNPRRIKRSCSRLQYGRKIVAPDAGATLFDELVTLRSKDEEVFEKVRELARTDAFAAVIGELEAWARDPKRLPTLPAAQELEQRIGTSRSLRRILAEPPEMSHADPKQVLMLSECADLRPHAERMFHSRDPIFMRLLDASRRGPVMPSKLIFDDFAKLAALRQSFPGVAAQVAGVARGDNWAQTMLQVEAALRPNGELPSVPEATNITNAVRACAPSPDQTTASTLIGSLPLLSSMPPQEVMAFDDVATSLPAPEQLIDKKLTKDPSLAEKGRALGDWAIRALSEHQMASIAEIFTVRQDVVRQVVDLRTFVKKDLLDHCWPALYDLMRRDYAGLVQFEKDMQSPDEAASKRLAEYLNDKGLVRLFGLQPYFRDMPEFVAMQPLPGVPEENIGTQLLASGYYNVRPPAASHAPPIEQPRVEYEDVYVTLKGTGLPNDPHVVEVRTSSLGQATTTLKQSIDWRAIREKLRGLPYLRRPNVLLTRDVAPPDGDILVRLKSLGLMVYDQLFQEDVRRSLLGLVAGGRSLRLHWQEDEADPNAAVLPWECLYVPTSPVGHLALTRTYSLTRRNSTVTSMVAPPITGTVRVMFATADPQMVAPLPMVDQEVETLNQAAAAAGNRVQVTVLRHAALRQVQDVLREFRPHIFHFSGHGVFSDGVGHLVFEEDGEARLSPAEQIAVLLHEHDVHLAVLNGCDTGVASANDAVSSVSGAVVRAGVPAVIATMREVQDEQAMLFTRDFYRAFFAGFTIEESLAAARKALSLDYWDWAAYTLFVGSADLDTMRVLTGLRSEAS